MVELYGGLLEQRLVLRLRADGALQEGVAVGCGLGDAIGAVHAAGAADIFDDDRLAQNLTHALREQPRHHVVGAAGRERVDHGERVGRPFLGFGAARGRERGRDKQDRQ